MPEDYLDRLEHHLGAYRGDDDSAFIDSLMGRRRLTVGDQRAAVAELKQLRAQVADFPEQLADAQEMALDKLVVAFGEGYDRCREHIVKESQAVRSGYLTEYSNTLPWPPYQPPSRRAEQ